MGKRHLPLACYIRTSRSVLRKYVVLEALGADIAMAPRPSPGNLHSKVVGAAPKVPGEYTFRYGGLQGLLRDL